MNLSGPSLLFFVALFSIYYDGLAIHIEINPRSFYELTQELNITCTAGGPAYWAKTVYTIELGKKDQPPMFIYGRKGLTKGPAMDLNMEAEGHIGDNAKDSFLRLTIKNPEAGNAGTYTCLVYYLNESYKMKEETTDTTITMEADSGRLVKELIAKVSNLEKLTTELKTKVLDQERKLERQANQINRIGQKQSISSAFHATKLGSTVVKTREVLKFLVEDNIGNDFDTATGIYTAPVDGLYAFTLFAMSWKLALNSVTEVSIVANNQKKATLLVKHEKNHDQSSVSCVVKLKAGQTVKSVVSHINNPHNGLYANPFTGFSGFLIKAQ